MTLLPYYTALPIDIVDYFANFNEESLIFESIIIIIINIQNKLKIFI